MPATSSRGAHGYGADAGIAVLVGLSGSALGLLRYGFAIASPRNDAIPNDSRDGHLPCEE